MASETSEPNKFQEKLKKKLMVSTVLDCFTKLTSEAEKLRVSAGLNLLKHLNSVDSTDKVRILTCGIWHHKQYHIYCVVYNFHYRKRVNSLIP